MVEVSFTGNLARHIDVETISVTSGTLTSVLEITFQRYPELKPYIVDEQWNLRKHVMLAVDKQLIQGQLHSYSDLTGFSRVHIMQALSGG
jgi:hypothetical protein